MTVARTLLGAAAGLAGRRLWDALTTPARPLPRRVRVGDGWRRVENGGAVRLDTGTTIAMARSGRWRAVDPLVVNEGWRRPWRAVGLALWAGTVGAAWWMGWSRGRGPLAALHSPRPTTSTTEPPWP